MLGDVWGERCWHHGSPFAGFGAQVWALFAELCPLPSLAGAVVGLGDGELLLLGNPGTQGFGSRCEWRLAAHPPGTPGSSLLVAETQGPATCPHHLGSRRPELGVSRRE